MAKQSHQFGNYSGNVLIKNKMNDKWFCDRTTSNKVRPGFVVSHMYLCMHVCMYILILPYLLTMSVHMQVYVRYQHDYLVFKDKLNYSLHKCLL